MQAVKPARGAATAPLSINQGKCMAHYDFNTPVSEADVRKLKVNDTVTLNQTLNGGPWPRGLRHRS